MPHERGPMPVLPSEFCVFALADPKFALPLASQPTTLANGTPA
jgi:hypothetical protein